MMVTAGTDAFNVQPIRFSLPVVMRNEFDDIVEVRQADDPVFQDVSVQVRRLLNEALNWTFPIVTKVHEALRLLGDTRW
jgi:hypothetical protein